MRNLREYFHSVDSFLCLCSDAIIVCNVVIRMCALLLNHAITKTISFEKMKIGSIRTRYMGNGFWCDLFKFIALIRIEMKSFAINSNTQIEISF